MRFRAGPGAPTIRRSWPPKHCPAPPRLRPGSALRGGPDGPSIHRRRGPRAGRRRSMPRRLQAPQVRRRACPQPGPRTRESGRRAGSPRPARMLVVPSQLIVPSQLVVPSQSWRTRPPRPAFPPGSRRWSAAPGADGRPAARWPAPHRHPYPPLPISESEPAKGILRTPRRGNATSCHAFMAYR